MKITTKYLAAAIVASVITAVGGSYITSLSYEKELTAQQEKQKVSKANLEACHEREREFCEGGSQFGEIRIINLECADKTELCLCGDPANLNRQRNH